MRNRSTTKKGGTDILDTLPSINLDLESEEVLDFINIQHDDIIDSDQLSTICMKMHPDDKYSKTNDAVIGYFTLANKIRFFYERNPFLDQSVKNSLFEALNHFNELVEKIEADRISQNEVHSELNILIIQITKLFNKTNEQEYHKVLDYSRSQITKSVQQIQKCKTDNQISAPNFDDLLNKFQRKC